MKQNFFQMPMKEVQREKESESNWIQYYIQRIYTQHRNVYYMHADIRSTE